ncbi:MALT1 [Mytilus edulis]|uniref:MALT1 n=1 Tax=Mytilus edulis TaxID=6550 RepID=A0A8S3QXJ7_MYTED|nr:MALT1 [Mytilus edulis]
MFILFVDVESVSVEVGGNLSGILGENGTAIECSYTRENVRAITRVDFKAFNRRTVTFEQIAGYVPDDISILLPQGQYLKGRVTLTRITQNSTKAVMLINKLMCIDDTFYKCSVTYNDDYLLSHMDTSGNISIQVKEFNPFLFQKVTPSKPDIIFWMTVSADSSSTTPTVPMSATTSSSSSAETISTTNIDKQNDITASTHSTLQTTDHNTTSSTPSGDDLFTDSSYRTTTQSIQTTTTAQGIAEATETFLSEISDNCSYYRTSNLTFQVTADDNKAIIRCVVNSSMADSDMYVETAPIEVYYEVSEPNITKYPNKPYYVVGEDTSIILTCKSDGNPKPHYQWYKKNDSMLISTNESWTITDMNVTNSGIYTCNVNNTFNDDTYRNVKYVQIDIMNKADISTTQSSSIGSSSGVDKEEEKPEGNLGLVIGIVVAVVTVIVVIIVIIACRRRKSKFPTSTNVSNSFDDSKPKPVTETRTGDYDYIALEDDAPKEKVLTMALKNTPPQPAVYAQVNEATKLKNKPNTDGTENTDKKEEDPYAESQENVYDKAETHVTKKMRIKQNSNGDNKQSIQTSQVGSYANQGFEKDENRKVATVSPTVRSSSGSQNDEQTNSNRNSQSKKGYENIIGTDQTGISVEESSHRTAL